MMPGSVQPLVTLQSQQQMVVNSRRFSQNSDGSLGGASPTLWTSPPYMHQSSKSDTVNWDVETTFPKFDFRGYSGGRGDSEKVADTTNNASETDFGMFMADASFGHGAGDVDCSKINQVNNNEGWSNSANQNSAKWSTDVNQQPLSIEHWQGVANEKLGVNQQPPWSRADQGIGVWDNATASQALGRSISKSDHRDEQESPDDMFGDQTLDNRRYENNENKL